MLLTLRDLSLKRVADLEYYYCTPKKPTAGSPENQVLEKDNKLTFETFMF